MTNPLGDADADADAGQSPAAVVAQMATESESSRTFDARKVRGTPPRRQNAGHLNGTPPIRPAALDDKHRLAELYYGGCREAPDGLSQATLGAYLGVTRSTVARAIDTAGLSLPAGGASQRRWEETLTQAPPAHLDVDATAETRPAPNQCHPDADQRGDV